jgi:hypothetical protein
VLTMAAQNTEPTNTITTASETTTYNVDAVLGGAEVAGGAFGRWLLSGSGAMPLASPTGGASVSVAN